MQNVRRPTSAGPTQYDLSSLSESNHTITRGHCEQREAPLWGQGWWTDDSSIWVHLPVSQGTTKGFTSWGHQEAQVHGEGRGTSRGFVDSNASRHMNSHGMWFHELRAPSSVDWRSLDRARARERRRNSGMCRHGLVSSHCYEGFTWCRLKIALEGARNP